MLRLTRKFVAVLMLMWLPIFTGSALAASVSMQLPQSGCNKDVMSQAMSGETMDMNMDEHAMHQGKMPAPAGEHNTCGVCHMACTAYLAVPGVDIPVAQIAAREITPYLVVFHSFTSAPLLPPPLVRA